ncbi:MAG: dipeptidase [Flammeovirgaceae bacterium]
MANTSFPIIDMHCDLLSYLSEHKGAHYANTEDIGCALPFMQEGNVKLQVLAVYSPSESGSTVYAQKQIPAFESLIAQQPFKAVTQAAKLPHTLTNGGVGVVVAIENASGLAEEDDSLDKVFERLDHFIEKTGRIIYISFTHHYENRFGGGNYATVGLKPDGEKLLDYMSGKGIAIDLSHASDALAYDILNYTEKRSLKVPVIASHSNFRTVWNHVRNLTDEMAQEIIRRKGLIGMNFLREYVDRENPDTLIEHVLYGLEQGGEDVLCFGADYFYVHAISDPNRFPLYFPAHDNASSYPHVLDQLREKGLSESFLEKLAYKNVMDFVERSWEQ